jgi:Ion transport protein
MTPAPYAELCQLSNSPADTIQLTLTLLFMLDMVVNFHVAVWRGGEWVRDRAAIAHEYIWGRWRLLPVGMFWVDLVAVFPFDWIIGAALQCDASDLETVELVRLLRLLRLFRLVRFLRLVCLLRLRSSRTCMQSAQCAVCTQRLHARGACCVSSATAPGTPRAADLPPCAPCPTKRHACAAPGPRLSQTHARLTCSGCWHTGAMRPCVHCMHALQAHRGARAAPSCRCHARVLAAALHLMHPPHALHALDALSKCSSCT